MTVRIVAQFEPYIRAFLLDPVAEAALVREDGDGGRGQLVSLGVLNGEAVFELLVIREGGAGPEGSDGGGDD